MDEYLLPFEFETIGSWWDKGQEIDRVAFNGLDRAILFCECKWRDGVNAESVLSRLKEKAVLVPWNREGRREHYAIIARSFSVRCTDPGVLCLDAGDLASLHRRCRE